MLFNLLILKHFTNLHYYSLIVFIIIIIIIKVIIIFIKIKAADFMINFLIVFILLFLIYPIFTFRELQLKLMLETLFFAATVEMLFIRRLKVEHFFIYYLKVFTMKTKLLQHIYILILYKLI